MPTPRAASSSSSSSRSPSSTALEPPLARPEKPLPPIEEEEIKKTSGPKEFLHRPASPAAPRRRPRPSAAGSPSPPDDPQKAPPQVPPHHHETGGWTCTLCTQENPVTTTGRQRRRCQFCGAFRPVLLPGPAMSTSSSTTTTRSEVGVEIPHLLPSTNSRKRPRLSSSSSNRPVRPRKSASFCDNTQPSSSLATLPSSGSSFSVEKPEASSLWPSTSTLKMKPPVLREATLMTTKDLAPRHFQEKQQNNADANNKKKKSDDDDNDDGEDGWENPGEHCRGRKMMMTKKESPPPEFTPRVPGPTDAPPGDGERHSEEEVTTGTDLDTATCAAAVEAVDSQDEEKNSEVDDETGRPPSLQELVTATEHTHIRTVNSSPQADNPTWSAEPPPELTRPPSGPDHRADDDHQDEKDAGCSPTEPIEASATPEPLSIPVRPATPNPCLDHPESNGASATSPQKGHPHPMLSHTDPEPADSGHDMPSPPAANGASTTPGGQHLHISQAPDAADRGRESSRLEAGSEWPVQPDHVEPNQLFSPPLEDMMDVDHPPEEKLPSVLTFGEPSHCQTYETHRALSQGSSKHPMQGWSPAVGQLGTQLRETAGCGTFLYTPATQSQDASCTPPSQSQPGSSPPPPRPPTEATTVLTLASWRGHPTAHISPLAISTTTGPPALAQLPTSSVRRSPWNGDHSPMRPCSASIERHRTDPASPGEKTSVEALPSNEELGSSQVLVPSNPHDKSARPAFLSAGSGATIAVSRASLAPAERLLGNSDEHSTHDQRSASCNTTFAMFTTAGKQKPVQVSESAISRAEALLTSGSDVEEDCATGDKAFTSFTKGYKSVDRSTPFVSTQSSKNLNNSRPMFQSESIGAEASQSKEDWGSSRVTPSNSRWENERPLFQSAGSGATIAVSRAGLAHAERLLGNSDEHSSHDEGSCRKHGNSRIAKRWWKQKPVHVSESAISRAEALLTSGSDVSEDCAKGDKAFTSFPKNFNTMDRWTPFVSTQSSKNLNKSLAMFQSESIGAEASQSKEDWGSSRVTPSNSRWENERPAFQSAGSGATIAVSRAGLAHAERLLGNSEAHSTHDEGSASYNTTVAMFTTAGKQKPVQVSESAISRAEALLTSGSDVEEDCAKGDKAFTSFTKGYKSVDRRTPFVFTQSSKNLNKSLAMFQSESIGAEASQSKEDWGSSRVTPSNSRWENERPAFQSAGSGATIAVSRAGLAHAERLLGNSEAHSTHDEGSASYNTTVAMFTTAGKQKPVQVSEAAISRAEALLTYGSDVKEDCAKGDEAFMSITKSFNPMDRRTPFVSTQSKDRNSSLPVFQSAGSGSAITVSNVSLANAEAIFRDRGTAETPNVEPCARPRVSFTTSGIHAPLRVSEGALGRAEEVLKSTSYDEESSTPQPCFFQSAGTRKAVSVTNTALENANRLFQETPITSLDNISRPRLPRVSFAPNRQATPTHLSCFSEQVRSKLSSDEAWKTPQTTCGLTSTTRVSVGRASTSSSDDVNSFPPETFLPVQVSFAIAGKRHPVRVSEAGTEESKTLNTSDGFSLVSVGASSTNDVPPSDYLCQGVLDPFNQTPARKPPARVSIATTWKSESPNEWDLGRDETSSPRQNTDGSNRQSVRSDGCGLSLSAVSLGVSVVTEQVTSSNSIHVRFDANDNRPKMFAKLGESFAPGSLGWTGDIAGSLQALKCDMARTSAKWIPNHMRWIVWKLASMERSFPLTLGGYYLTYDRLIKELGRRFRREIEQGKRPAVRKILNRDVSASCMMILVVARVFPRQQANDQRPFLELTDGWYSLRALPDLTLSMFIQERRIRVGTKLLISNASLRGFEEGIDPLDVRYDPSLSERSPELHLFANSTRLAKWTSKLGFVQNERKIQAVLGRLRITRFSDVFDDGGIIPLMDLKVIEKNPLLYLEGKRHDGCKPRVFTEAEEHLKSEKAMKERLEAIEAATELVQAECEKEVDENAPAIWHEMNESIDPEVFLENINFSEKLLIEQWMSRRTALLRERVRQEVDAKLEEQGHEERSTVPFLRLVVASIHALGGGKPDNYANLTVWTPSAEQLEMLKVGAAIRMINLEPRPGLFRGLLQLSAYGETPMEKIADEQAAEAKEPNEFVNIFHAVVLSKKIGDDQSREKERIDLLGIVLKAYVQDDRVIYLTDQTGLIVRLLCDRLRDHDLMLSLSSFEKLTAQGSPNVLGFRSVQVMHYDHSRHCGVLQCTALSSIVLHPQCEQAKWLNSWSSSEVGIEKMKRALWYFEAFLRRTQASTSFQSLTAVGIISGFHVLPTKQLVVRVDSGGSVDNLWHFPLSLISELCELVGDLSMKVVLNQEEEERIGLLTSSLMSIFRARHANFTFTLRKMDRDLLGCPKCQFTITSIRLAAAEALCYLYPA